MAQSIGKAPQKAVKVRRGTAAKPAAVTTQQQQNARHAPPRQQRAARQLPVPPQSVGELRGLLRQYGNVLTPQNKQLLQEVITQLEKGDKAALQNIAARLQKQLGR